MTIEAYPLAWPPGWRRTTVRSRAKFVGKVGRHVPPSNGGTIGSWEPKRDLTIEQARVRVMDELRRFGVPDFQVIISSNLKLRKDGYPMSGQAMPTDPGVAVYWKHAKGEQRCMAVDRYDRAQDNLAAIAATLEAMRAIERHGGATILDRAFTGFNALPAPEQWFQVLDVPASAAPPEIEQAYRRLASIHHPDKSHDNGEMMARINRARDQGMEQYE